MLADRKYPLTLAALFGLYVVAGKLGLSLAFVHVRASPVWPPTGIALAALLTLGYRVWPAIFRGRRVEAFSEGPGRGSEFVVRLPRIPPTKAIDAQSALRVVDNVSSTRCAAKDSGTQAIYPSRPVMHGCG